MKKAALIVEAPDNCLRCNFCIRDNLYPQCRLDKAIGRNYNTVWEKLDQIPEWCPLIPIPEKMEDCHGYNKGWNDLLDKIVRLN